MDIIFFTSNDQFITIWILLLILTPIYLRDYIIFYTLYRHRIIPNDKNLLCWETRRRRRIANSLRKIDGNITDSPIGDYIIYNIIIHIIVAKLIFIICSLQIWPERSENGIVRAFKDTQSRQRAQRTRPPRSSSPLHCPRMTIAAGAEGFSAVFVAIHLTFGPVLSQPAAERTLFLRTARTSAAHTRQWPTDWWWTWTTRSWRSTRRSFTNRRTIATTRSPTTTTRCTWATCPRTSPSRSSSNLQSKRRRRHRLGFAERRATAPEDFPFSFFFPFAFSRRLVYNITTLQYYYWVYFSSKYHTIVFESFAADRICRIGFCGGEGGGVPRPEVL